MADHGLFRLLLLGTRTVLGREDSLASTRTNYCTNSYSTVPPVSVLARTSTVLTALCLWTSHSVIYRKRQHSRYALSVVTVWQVRFTVQQYYCTTCAFGLKLIITTVRLRYYQKRISMLKMLISKITNSWLLVAVNARMVPALGCAIGYSALMAGWMQYYFLYPLKQEAWEMVCDMMCPHHAPCNWYRLILC